MRKIAIFLVSLAILFSSLSSKVQAASTCQGVQQGVGGTLQNGASSHTIVMDLGAYPDGDKYQFKIKRPGDGSGLADSPFFTVGVDGELSNNIGTLTIRGNLATWVVTAPVALEETNRNNTEKRAVTMWESPGILWFHQTCELGVYTAAEFSNSATGSACESYAYQEREGEKCYSTGCLAAGGVFTHIEASGLKETDGKPYNGQVFIRVQLSGAIFSQPLYERATNGNVTGQFETKEVGVYSITLSKYANGMIGKEICNKFSFKTSETSQACLDICGEKGSVYSQQPQPNFELCEQIPDETQRENCLACFGEGAEGENPGVWTAIGCIPIEPTSIIQTLIRLGLGLGGGITLLLILAGAFRLSTSQGDPKQAEEAKEQITSAVIGLLFIIFSIVMLRFIGVQVLQIPGFGT